MEEEVCAHTNNGICNFMFQNGAEAICNGNDFDCPGFVAEDKVNED